MTSKLKIISTFVFGSLLYFSLSSFVLAVALPSVQTNSATNIQNNSATLNGNVYDLGGYGSANVWFQWGTNSNYQNRTNSIVQNYTGNFSQQVFNLFPNQTYHYRAVAQNSYGTFYGQDMTFTTSQSGNQQITVNAGPDLYLNSGQTATLQGSAYDYTNNYINYSWGCNGGTLSSSNSSQPVYTAPYVSQYNSQNTYTCTLVASNSFGQSNSDSATIYINYNSSNNVLLSVSKTARNLSSGSLNWSTSINASPLDVLQFLITIRASGNQTIHNAYVRDIFPANLIYYNNLTVDGVSTYSNITQGINIGDLYYGQTKTIIYQGQIASPTNFNYGQTTLVNSVSVSSTEANNSTASATIYVTKTGLLGATSISTGLTNNFLTDSFFIPLILMILAMWLWKSGAIYSLIYWIKLKVK